MTERELFREFVVAKRLARERHERDVTASWTTAALMRQEKFPKLRDLLRERQTPEEQAAVWRHAAQAFGLRVRRHNPRRVRIVRVH